MWTKEGLLELIEARLRDHKFILVSNREPYVHRYAGRQVECVQPASGLAVALDPIMRACGGPWRAHASGCADHTTLDAHDRALFPPPDPRLPTRRVWRTRHQHERHD